MEKCAPSVEWRVDDEDGGSDVKYGAERNSGGVDGDGRGDGEEPYRDLTCPCCSLDHTLEPEPDTLPLNHESQIYMHNVCHGLLSLYFCRNSN